MNNPRRLLWLISLIILLLLIPLIVPSSVMMTDAGAEEADDPVPVYEPVVLANPDVEPLPTPKRADYRSGAAVYAPHEDGFIRDEDGNLTGYLDGTISVRIEEGTYHGTKVLFTWVQIADASQLQAAFTAQYPQENLEWPTSLARTVHFVVAINGDWAGGHGFGLVARQGIQLHKARYGDFDALIVDFDGNFHILKQPELSDFDAFEGQIKHSFVFGPALVIDGEAQQYPDNERKKMNIPARQQRQAICQIDELSYLLITTEGPEQSADGGFNINELALLAQACGAKQAYNLDGGSSTWLVLGNDRINNLQSKNKRGITDIIYFVTAEPDLNPAE
ncbi:MAG: phosphodiester glycosidase family protein [Clostridiales bacterium]|nr:phosphodiester glycosidase family protein [Clostridiales bacterium]